MAFDNTVTIVGNVTREPELRFTPSGAAVVNFGVAWNRKGKDGEDIANFFDVTAWNQLAENVAACVPKGARVVVYGRLDQRSWETDNGERRSKVEVTADDVAPSLKWAVATVERNERSDNGGGRTYGGGGGSDKPAYDPSEEPF